MKLFQKLYKYKFYVFIALIGVLFFNTILLNYNKILASIDILYVFSPNKLFLSETLRNYFTLPLWNNYFFSGTPFLANPTSGMFYPLNYLFFIFKTEFVFGYLFLLNSILIGIFTFIYCRTIKLSELASLVSAITFMLSGSIITRIFPGHLFIVDAIVWFPLSLYFFEKIIETRKVAYAIAGSLSISAMFFAGHTQITFYSLLILFLYFILRSFTEYKKDKKIKELKKAFLLLLSSVLIFIGLVAIQLIPTLEYSKLLTRASGISFEFASNFSLHPYQLVSFIFPNFYGTNINNTFWGIGNIWETSGYLGILSLVLAFTALIYKRNKYTFIFFIFSIFSILFSLGKYSFIFQIFFNYFPFMDNFRVPSRMLFIYSFSISILAGFGLDYILRLKRDFKSFRFINLFIVSILVLPISIILILTIFDGSGIYEKYILKNSYAVGINHKLLYTQFLNDLIVFCSYLILFLLSIYLYIKLRISKLTFSLFVIAIIFSNLYFYGNNFLILDSPEKIYSTPNIIKEIKKDKERYRVLDLANDYVAFSTKNDIEYVLGVEAGILKDYRDITLLMGEHTNLPYESFFIIKSIKNENILNLFNNKYIISDKELKLKNYEFVYKEKYNLFNQNKTDYLYVNKSPLPRAYIVSNFKVLSSRNEILKLIKEDKVDYKNSVLLEKIPGISNSDKVSNFKDVDISFYSPNRIDINTHLDKKGFLVLSEIWYPGWKVFDNGKEVEIYRANYIFRALALEQGSHEISFVYDPFSYKLGGIITFSTIVFIIVLVILLYKNNYKRLFSLVNKN